MDDESGIRIDEDLANVLSDLGFITIATMVIVVAYLVEHNLPILQLKRSAHVVGVGEVVLAVPRSLL